MDLAELGKQFGLDAAQTQAAIDALAPVVAAGIRRNTQDDGGFADLISALARGNHAQYVDDPAVLESPVVVDDGNAILGHVFGSKDVSRGVAQQLSASSGIGASVLKKLLPIVAAMVMGQIAKKALGGGAASRAPRRRLHLHRPAEAWATFSVRSWAGVSHRHKARAAASGISSATF